MCGIQKLHLSYIVKKSTRPNKLNIAAPRWSVRYSRCSQTIYTHVVCAEERNAMVEYTHEKRPEEYNWIVLLWAFRWVRLSSPTHIARQEQHNVTINSQTLTIFNDDEVERIQSLASAHHTQHEKSSDSGLLLLLPDCCWWERRDLQKKTQGGREAEKQQFEKPVPMESLLSYVILPRCSCADFTMLWRLLHTHSERATMTMLQPRPKHQQPMPMRSREKKYHRQEEEKKRARTNLNLTAYQKAEYEVIMK